MKIVKLGKQVQKRQTEQERACERIEELDVFGLVKSERKYRNRAQNDARQQNEVVTQNKYSDRNSSRDRRINCK